MEFRERSRSALHFDQAEGRTKQAFKDECDINQILLNWRRTGEIRHTNHRPAAYGDFSLGVDYQDACNAVINANIAFSELPARTRALMGNDPGKLLDFIADPANAEECVALGLMEFTPDPEATTVPTETATSGETPTVTPNSTPAGDA